MSDSANEATLGHDFDGIQEYDNRLPNWWLFTLYATIVFSVGYWLFFHTFGVGAGQDESYEREVSAANEAQLARELGKEVSDESLRLLLQAPAQLEAGAAIFRQKCAQCHGAQGGGDIGPNLTDDYWLHGPSPLAIHQTVAQGVLDKGMQAWMDQLGPLRVRQVVAHVLTLREHPVSGKAPQGKPSAEWSALEAQSAPGVPTTASAQ